MLRKHSHLWSRLKDTSHLLLLPIVVGIMVSALWANAGTRQGRGFETRNAAYLMRPWQAETGNMLNHRSRQGICSSMGDSVS